jgi:hypothetical protein
MWTDLWPDADPDVDETFADGWTIEWAAPAFNGRWGDLIGDRADLASPLAVKVTRGDGVTFTLSPSAHSHLMRLSDIVDLAGRAFARADNDHTTYGSTIFYRWSNRLIAVFLNALVRFPDDLRQTVLHVADVESSDPPCQVLWNVFKAAVAEERRRRRASGLRTSKSATAISTSV